MKFENSDKAMGITNEINIISAKIELLKSKRTTICLLPGDDIPKGVVPIDENTSRQYGPRPDKALLDIEKNTLSQLAAYYEQVKAAKILELEGL